MATLSVQTITRDGLQITENAAAEGGDQYSNDGTVWIKATNGNASDIEITFATPNTVDGQTIGDRVVDVPAGEEWLISPMPTGTYNDGSGFVQMTYEHHESLTIALFKV